MIERIFIIAAICNSNCVFVIDPISHDEQEELVPDVDFDLFTLPPVSLRDLITDDEVFVSSPYQTTRCLPYFVQYNQVVQEIVRPHLRMNFKFRNKIFCHK